MIVWPHVTIVFAAKTEQEAQRLLSLLENQEYHGTLTYSYSTLPGIAEAMNEAINKAEGELLLFTETDVEPINIKWIKTMVLNSQKGCFVRGLEVNHRTPNWSNTILYKEDLHNEKLDTNFSVAEDTEFFNRMVSKYGITLSVTRDCVVEHLKEPDSDKAVQRAYEYGMNEIRIMKKYNNYSMKEYRDRQLRKILIAQATLKGIDEEMKRL